MAYIIMALIWLVCAIINYPLYRWFVYRRNQVKYTRRNALENLMFSLVLGPLHIITWLFCILPILFNRESRLQRWLDTETRL